VAAFLKGWYFHPVQEPIACRRPETSYSQLLPLKNWANIGFYFAALFFNPLNCREKPAISLEAYSADTIGLHYIA
jgi:hypothetical protein